MTDDTQRQPAYEPEPTPPIETDAAAIDAPAVGAADQAPGAGFQAAPAPVAASGPSRARWAVGVGVAGLAVALVIGAVVLLGASKSPEALRYIPGDAVFVAELRLDLPGDQLQKVGNLLAHFPGFRDQSTLGDKIDEALSQLVTAASDGGMNFRTDLKPWLNGPAFIGASAPGNGQRPTGIVSATTNGAVDCATVLKGQVTHEDYRSLDLTISSGGAGESLACVIDGRQALLGDPASVRAGLDAKAAGTGMDKNDKYRAARTALGEDRIATMFVSGSALMDLIAIPQSGTDGVPSLGSFDPLGGLAGLAGAVPEWTMVGVRGEDDALVVDTVAAPVPAPTGGPSLLPLPGTHASSLAGMLPADTILFVESQGAGVALQNLLATMKADEAFGQPLAMLDGLGGTGELLGWIEDAGVAVVADGASLSGGVLLVAADDSTAAARLTTFKGLLSLLGLSGGGIEVTETTVNGVEVTTVAITDLGALIPPGSLPGGVTPPATTEPITFSIAAKGKVLLVGIGEEFMPSVLSVQAGASLADDAAFKAASQRSLANSRTTVYLGVATGRELIAGFLPAEALATWQSDVLPYLEPIQALAMTSSSDAAVNRSRVVITVTQP